MSILRPKALDTAAKCWFCNKPGATKRNMPDGRCYREPMCDSCRDSAKASGYPIADTPVEKRVKALEAEIVTLKGSAKHA